MSKFISIHIYKQILYSSIQCRIYTSVSLNMSAGLYREIKFFVSFLIVSSIYCLLILSSVLLSHHHFSPSVVLRVRLIDAASYWLLLLIRDEQQLFCLQRLPTKLNPRLTRTSYLSITWFRVHYEHRILFRTARCHYPPNKVYKIKIIIWLSNQKIISNFFQDLITSFVLRLLKRSVTKQRQ